MSLLWPIIWHAIKSPKRVAVIDDRRQYTYRELVGGAMFLADQIEDRTDARHVGIMLPTSGAFPVALLGIWLAKRVAVPLNYLLAGDQLRYVIGDSEIDTIITAEAMLDFLGGPQVIPDGIKLFYMEQADFSGFPPLRWPPAYRPDDLAALLYTSGTSGRPKGVMLTHGNLRSNVDAAISHADLSSANIILGVLPQFHSFGLTALTLIPLRLGAKVVYSARFVPKRIIRTIREHRPDLFMAVPSMYGALLSVKDATADDFSSIRSAISGAEPLPQATYDACQERFNLRILEGYGLTETAPVTNWSTPERSKLHSVGLALRGVTVLIVDDADKPVPPDTNGEILIAGPNVMKGYFHLPEQTKEAFVNLPHPKTGKSTRFFRSGDMGQVDDEGFLRITGRIKEMLIIGGENVFPREIEEVLNRHPSVKDSAVIGKTDPMRGELPIAFVELNEEQSFDEAALRSWCRDNLAGYKVPRQIRQLDALPRNPTGKIIRRQLQAD